MIRLEGEVKDPSLKFLVPKMSMKTRTAGLMVITKAWKEAIWISGEGGLELSAGRQQMPKGDPWK